ncbi:hypothetical protein D3C80_179190 [compost metagenome]
MGRSRWRVWVGPRSSPASRGDPGWMPAAAPVSERRRPVPVRQGAGARPQLGGILAGGLRRPWCPIGGCRYRCGWVPELARPLGRSWPGAPGGPGARTAAAGGGVAGCRSSPSSWGDHGRGPAAVRFPSGGGRYRCGSGRSSMPAVWPQIIIGSKNGILCRHI